jgi:tRNA modification GTPase
LPLDICAVDLNDALASLGRITGDNYSEELLDEVFSAFCVGK